MRRRAFLLALCLVVGLAAPCRGAFALVASTSGSGLSGFTTSAIDTSGASLLVVMIGVNISTGSISDSKSNTWSALTYAQNAGGVNSGKIYYVQNPTVGSGHTFTFGGTAPSGEVLAFSGAKTSGVFDADHATSDISSSSVQDSAGVTPSEDNELVIAGVTLGGSAVSSINGGFATPVAVAFQGGDHYGSGISYLIQTTAAAANPTWTLAGSAPATAHIACFKSSGAGPAAVAPMLPLLGAGPGGQ